MNIIFLSVLTPPPDIYHSFHVTIMNSKTLGPPSEVAKPPPDASPNTHLTL